MFKIVLLLLLVVGVSEGTQQSMTGGNWSVFTPLGTDTVTATGGSTDNIDANKTMKYYRRPASNTQTQTKTTGPWKFSGLRFWSDSGITGSKAWPDTLQIDSINGAIKISSGTGTITGSNIIINAANDTFLDQKGTVQKQLIINSNASILFGGGSATTFLAKTPLIMGNNATLTVNKNIVLDPTTPLQNIYTIGSGCTINGSSYTGFQPTVTGTYYAPFWLSASAIRVYPAASTTDTVSMTGNIHALSIYIQDPNATSNLVFYANNDSLIMGSTGILTGSSIASSKVVLHWGSSIDSTSGNFDMSTFNTNVNIDSLDTASFIIGGNLMIGNTHSVYPMRSTLKFVGSGKSTINNTLTKWNNLVFGKSTSGAVCTTTVTTDTLKCTNLSQTNGYTYLSSPVICDSVIKSIAGRYYFNKPTKADSFWIGSYDSVFFNDSIKTSKLTIGNYDWNNIKKTVFGAGAKIVSPTVNPIISSWGSAVFPAIYQPAYTVKFKILGIGQSNMCGYGAGPGLPKINKGSKWIYSSNAWAASTDPTSNDTAMRGGSAIPKIVSNLSTYWDTTVGFINMGYGGRSMGNWDSTRNAGNPADPTTRYGTAITAATAAGTIDAAIFIGGENDLSNSTDTAIFRHCYQNMINNIRSDLSLPNLPIIIVPTWRKNNKYATTAPQYENIEKSFDNPLNKIYVIRGEKFYETGIDSVHLTQSALNKMANGISDAILFSQGIGNTYYDPWIVQKLITPNTSGFAVACSLSTDADSAKAILYDSSATATWTARDSTALLPGGALFTLTRTGAAASTAYKYRVWARNNSGTMDSAFAPLTVTTSVSTGIDTVSGSFAGADENPFVDGGKWFYPNVNRYNKRINNGICAEPSLFDAYMLYKNKMSSNQSASVVIHNTESYHFGPIICYDTTGVDSCIGLSIFPTLGFVRFYLFVPSLSQYDQLGINMNCTYSNLDSIKIKRQLDTIYAYDNGTLLGKQHEPRCSRSGFPGYYIQSSGGYADTLWAFKLIDNSAVAAKCISKMFTTIGGTIKRIIK